MNELVQLSKAVPCPAPCFTGNKARKKHHKFIRALAHRGMIRLLDVTGQPLNVSNHDAHPDSWYATETDVAVVRNQIGRRIQEKEAERKRIEDEKEVECKRIKDEAEYARQWSAKSMNEQEAELRSKPSQFHHILEKLILTRKSQYAASLRKLRAPELKKLNPAESWQQDIITARIDQLREAKAERKRRQQSLTAAQAHASREAADTRAFGVRLKSRGPMGVLAAELFRAQKASDKAKLPGYRKSGVGFRSYSSLSYERKGNALASLVSHLLQTDLGIKWGWAMDESQPDVPWVLYIEIATGQVSFHSPDRLGGPDYEKSWDGSQESQQRILKFCDQILTQDAVPAGIVTETEQLPLLAMS